jgi:hypothetical protein
MTMHATKAIKADYGRIEKIPSYLEIQSSVSLPMSKTFPQLPE